MECCRATGSYDHSICLWDVRISKCVLRLQVCINYFSLGYSASFIVIMNLQKVVIEAGGLLVVSCDANLHSTH